MLQTQLWISLALFCFVIFCHGYLIDVTSCKQYNLQPIREDGSARFPCSGTDDNMKWDMYYYINNTYHYWETIATCSLSGCTNLQENRYVSTRHNSSASILQILHADRVNIGQQIRCSSLSGNLTGSCRLMLYYESTPSDCWMELDRATTRVTVSCVTNKFYFSTEFPQNCRVYQYYEAESTPVEMFGKLVHSTIVDRVTGREYENGTCSVSTFLRRGYGTYVYKIALSFFTKDLALPVDTLHFAPEQTTPLSPVQTSQQPNVGTTGGTASTATPSSPEKATQPAPGDGTGGGDNTTDFCDKFTYVYALVGVSIALLIAIVVVFVVLWKARRGQNEHGRMSQHYDEISEQDGASNKRNRAQAERPNPPTDPPRASNPGEGGAPNSRNTAQAERPTPPTDPVRAFNSNAASSNSSDQPLTDFSSARSGMCQPRRHQQPPAEILGVIPLADHRDQEERAAQAQSNQSDSPYQEIQDELRNDAGVYSEPYSDVPRNLLTGPDGFLTPSHNQRSSEHNRPIKSLAKHIPPDRKKQIALSAGLNPRDRKEPIVCPAAQIPRDYISPIASPSDSCRTDVQEDSPNETAGECSNSATAGECSHSATYIPLLPREPKEPSVYTALEK